MTETDKEKAIRLLSRQLKELETVRRLAVEDGEFKAWRATTTSLLNRYLSPDSTHLSSFKSINYYGYAFPSSGANYRRHFEAGCSTAEAMLRAILFNIEEFGVHVQQPARNPEASPGAVHQTFHGPVTIQSQAIATNNAIQNIGNMGHTVGASLKEIATLFEQSGELRQREVREGLAGIEALAVEIRKPRCNWKSVLEYGQVVLAIADKATDMAQKLLPYTSHIATVVEQARNFLK